jgi:hypothetical protein
MRKRWIKRNSTSFSIGSSISSPIRARQDNLKADDDLVELLRTTDPARLMVLRSVLDSAEISYMVQGGESLWLNSWGLSGSLFNPSSLCAIIWVRREDLDDARALLQHPPEPEAEE